MQNLTSRQESIIVFQMLEGLIRTRTPRCNRGVDFFAEYTVRIYGHRFCKFLDSLLLSVRWDMDGRKSDQMRPNLRDTKKQDFVNCLKINNLQSLVVSP